MRSFAPEDPETPLSGVSESSSVSTGCVTPLNMRRLLRIFFVSNPFHSKGFSLIEILMVVSIISIIGAASVPSLRRFMLGNDLEVGAQKVVGTIRKAQSYAQDGKNNETWGVCLLGINLRMFSGSCTLPTFFEDFEIPRTVTISGLSETTFSKLRGEPSNLLNISLSTDFGARTVQVNSAGGMEVN